MRDKIVANLGGDDNFVALRWKSPGDQLFTQTIAVGIGGIEQSDSEIKGLVHEGNCLAFREIAPPAGRDGPEAEADLADLEIGIFVGAEAHESRKDSTLDPQLSTIK